jgi:hypothetical protein
MVKTKLALDRRATVYKVTRLVLSTVPVLLLCLPGVLTQNRYVELSSPPMDSGRPDLAAWTTPWSSATLREMRDLARRTATPTVVCDSPHVVLSKLISLYLRGKILSFPSRDILPRSVLRTFNRRRSEKVWLPAWGYYGGPALALADTRENRFVNEQFDLKTNDPSTRWIEFVADSLGQPPDTPPGDVTVLEATPAQGILNRRQFRQDERRVFSAQLWSSVRDHLIFISTPRGEHYYSWPASVVTFCFK